jgi:hypothetical protein
MISGILRPTSGAVTVKGAPIWTQTSDRLADFRLHTIGFVFQDYHLFPRLTAAENVAIPLLLQDRDWDESIAAANKYLEIVGLKGRGEILPVKFSGGEQQRVAIARAIVSGPQILVFDEPTASLDGDTGRMIISFVTYSAAGSNFGALSAANGRFWSLGPSASIPVFRGGTLWFGRKAAIDAYQAAEATYRQTVLDAFAQVADSLKALEHDAQALQAEAGAQRAAAKPLTLLQVSNRADLVSHLEVWAADVQLHEATIGYWQASQGATRTPWPCSSRWAGDGGTPHEEQRYPAHRLQAAGERQGQIFGALDRDRFCGVSLDADDRDVRRDTQSG